MSYFIRRERKRICYMYSARWYDIDPTLSLAISLLRNSQKEVQINAADFIIKNAEKRNIKISSKLSRIFQTFTRRWYDYHQTVSKAFQYLQNASENEQKEIAVELINYLYKIEQNPTEIPNQTN